MSSGDPIPKAIRSARSKRKHRLTDHMSQSQPGRDRGSPSKNTGNRNQAAPYTICHPHQFDLQRLAKPENLHAVFRHLQLHGGHGAGADGLTYNDYSPSEIYKALRAVSSAIVNRTYCPYGTRTVRIPKGDGRHRELKLQRITDRVVAKSLQLALDGYWRALLPRLGKDVLHLYAEMERVIRERRAYWIAIDDVKNCFPSSPVSATLACHSHYITHQDLLWLIETVIRGAGVSGHTVGIDQGSPYSSSAVELLLYSHLDNHFVAHNGNFPTLLRYVDNINIVCGGESDAVAALGTCSALLGRIGLTLKGTDGPPIDIRKNTSALLGLIPQWRNDELKFTVPSSAYEHLRTGFEGCLTSKDSHDLAMSVASGWLGSIGPAFAGTAANSIVARVMTIARESGFVEVRQRPLMKIGYAARNRWTSLIGAR